MALKNIYAKTKEENFKPDENFLNQVDCTLRGETYSARDNGSVLRLPLVGRPTRKNDGHWTFGRFDQNTGFMMFCGEPVHRIIAFAFLELPPFDSYVVEHIDGNLRNNRPENL